MIKQKKEFFVLRYLSYLRFPFMAVFGLLYLVFCCTVFILAVFLIRSRSLENKIISFWAKGMCLIFFIKVEVLGIENLPKKGCVIVFNHASHFDIPIMYSVLNKEFRFGAKVELLKVPFLGPVIKHMGALPIHRGRRNEVLKLYEKSIARINRGESFSLAPEGTRNSESKIGKFKMGPFIFASQAKSLILPVVINGAFEVMSKTDKLVNKGRWSRRVVVEVLPAVDASQYPEDEVLKLQDSIRTKMVNAYEALSAQSI